VRALAWAYGLLILPGIAQAQLCPIEAAFAEVLSLDAASSPGIAPWARTPREAPFTAGPARAEAPANIYRQDPGAGGVEQVVLRRLYGNGRILDGRYARVRSDRLEASGEATPGLGGEADFRFDPVDWETEDCLNVMEDCSPFDAVNTYYHIDRMATEFWLDRFGVDPSFQAEVVTHISGDGGFADPARDLIKLGAGWLFMRNAAKEDEIIYHEYTHLVASQLGFELSTDTPVEARALNEGYADYFAASFNDDPRIGEWIVTCPPRQQCLGPPDDTDFRTLSTDPMVWNWQGGSPATNLKYGVCTRFHEGDLKCKTSWNNFTPTYTWGMIWGGLLWDLRETLGADVTDFLALEAMSRTESPTETFERAVGRLITADGGLFGGAHTSQIVTAAAVRGIAVATRTIPSQRPPPLRLSAHPLPGNGPIRLNLDLERATPLVIRAFDASGRGISQIYSGMVTFGTTVFEWDTGSLPAGVYFVRVDTEDGFRLVTPVVLTR
jgi:hypothetical protein